MQQLASFVGGRWVEGRPGGQALVNPATEEPLATASTEGIDLAAALEYARATGGRALRAATWLLFAGVAVFAGDLLMRHYAGTRLFPFAAPSGGVAMIAGWLAIAGAALLSQRSS